MKNAVLFTILFVSFNVHATPPPPPMPPPIGFLTANVSMEIRVNDLKKCDGGFCDQVWETCSLTVKVPVITSGKYDQGYSPNTSVSVDGKSMATCKKLHGGLEHTAYLGIYATLDTANNKLKVIADTRSGKRIDHASFSLDDSARTVIVVAASSPSLKFEGSELNQVHSPFEKTKENTILGNTNHSISTDIEFTSLAVEPAQK